jgi:hypothetical protein
MLPMRDPMDVGVVGEAASTPRRRLSALALLEADTKRNAKQTWPFTLAVLEADKQSVSHAEETLPTVPLTQTTGEVLEKSLAATAVESEESTPTLHGCHEAAVLISIDASDDDAQGCTVFTVSVRQGAVLSTRTTRYSATAHTLHSATAVMNSSHCGVCTVCEVQVQ